MTTINTYLRAWGGSPYAQILATYTARSASGAIFSASSNISLTSITYDAYSSGTSLGSLSAVFNVVQRALVAGSFPIDDEGVYLVLTSSDGGLILSFAKFGLTISLVLSK